MDLVTDWLRTTYNYVIATSDGGQEPATEKRGNLKENM
jgi:hypothetical protein